MENVKRDMMRMKKKAIRYQMKTQNRETNKMVTGDPGTDMRKRWRFMRTCRSWDNITFTSMWESQRHRRRIIGAQQDGDMQSDHLSQCRNAGKEKAMDKDDHVIEDHNVIDCAFGNHDVRPNFKGEPEQAGEPRPKSNRGKDKPTCEDDRVMNGHDVNDHATSNHDVSQNHRRESEPRLFECSSPQGIEKVEEREFPWIAPRVILQYLTWGTMGNKPTIWSLDNRDGWESWLECKQRPREEYKGDRKATANRYHKMLHALYQLEGATDNLTTNQGTTDCEEQAEGEWQHIKDGIDKVCMDMYNEIESDETNEDELKSSEHNARDLAMFEKGSSL